MATISLDTLTLGQLHGEHKALLDIIDDLRKHVGSRKLNLPQMIVVGDQSSGKSSVLEAISRVKFPVKNGVCTKFATELVLRTSSNTKVDVRVRHASSTNKDVRSFNETHFDENELPRLIEDAKSIMVQGENGFSEDILQIELHGPNIPELTLVDLPGFFYSEDEHQSPADRELVDRLVENYMAASNSIILAVIEANKDLVMQQMLQKLNVHDKDRKRTLGIITKPDCLDPGSELEDRVVQLAKNLNKSHKLDLGWHLLRNRGKDEESSHEERDQTEKDFFQRDTWSSVPSKNRGIADLRRKLSGILLDHIKSHLPDLIKNVEDAMRERQNTLKRLGEVRSNRKDLRAYLDKIASQFHVITLYAIEGRYSHHKFFDGYSPSNKGMTESEDRERKLRALIRNLNRTFTYILATKGSKRIILPQKYIGVEVSEDGQEYSSDDEQEGSSEYGHETSQQKLPAYLQDLLTYYHFEEPEYVSFEQETNRLDILSSANQGNEFPGSTNDQQAVEFFRFQSQPWEAIARNHIKIIRTVAQRFVEILLTHLTNSDVKTYEAILTEFVDPFFERKTSLLETKMQELLHHYRNGYPQPLDAEFRSTLFKRHQKRVEKDVLRDLLKRQPELFTEAAREKLTDTMGEIHQSEFDTETVIEKTETYYEMSLRTFTENIIILAVENCLVEDLPSIFDTEKVSQMEDEQLHRIAAESKEIQDERAEAKKEYDALLKGLQSCNKYRERKAIYLAELESPSQKSDLKLSANRTPSSTELESISKSQSGTASSNFVGGTAKSKRHMRGIKPNDRINRKGNTKLATNDSSESNSSNSPANGSGGLFPWRTTDVIPVESGGLFGAKRTTDVSTAESVGLFGAKRNTDVSPAESGGLFGAKRTTEVAPAKSGGLFGAKRTTEVAPAKSGGLFGAKRTPDIAPANSGGLFGVKRTTNVSPAESGGLFGAKRTTTLPSADSVEKSGSLGNNLAVNAGSTSSTSVFGMKTDQSITSENPFGYSAKP